MGIPLAYLYSGLQAMRVLEAEPSAYLHGGQHPVACAGSLRRFLQVPFGSSRHTRATLCRPSPVERWAICLVHSDNW